MQEKTTNNKREKFLPNEAAIFVGNPAKLEVKDKKKSFKDLFGASSLLLIISLLILTFGLVSTNLLLDKDGNKGEAAPTASELKIDKTIEDINNELSDVDEDLAYQEFEDSELSVEPEDESVGSTIEEIDTILELSESLEEDLDDFDENFLD